MASDDDSLKMNAAAAASSLKRNCRERYSNPATAANYAKFRCSQPPKCLVDYLVSLVPERKLVWDVATGNGQAAVELAPHFDRVLATDQSAAQIAHSVQHANICYKVLPAEMTEQQLAENGFEAGSFDLITVSSAIQWLDSEKFFPIVSRLLKKPNGVFACWSISGSLFEFPDAPQLNEVLSRMQEARRSQCRARKLQRDNSADQSLTADTQRFICKAYENLTNVWQLNEIIPPMQFTKQFTFTVDSFIGRLTTYGLNSKPSTSELNSTNDQRPPASLIDQFSDEIREAWGQGNRTVDLPIRLKVGRIRNSHQETIPAAVERSVSMPLEPCFCILSLSSTGLLVEGARRRSSVEPFCNEMPKETENTNAIATYC